MRIDEFDDMAEVILVCRARQFDGLEDAVAGSFDDPQSGLSASGLRKVTRYYSHFLRRKRARRAAAATAGKSGQNLLQAG